MSTEEKAVLGAEWYSDDPAAKTLWLARQRARFKAAMVGKQYTVEEAVRRGILQVGSVGRELSDAEQALLTITSEEAEVLASELRWDMTERGEVLGTPAKSLLDQEEAPYPKLVQRVRVRISTDKIAIQPDGVEAATITIEGLVAGATAELGGSLTAPVSPTDPTIVLRSDIPRVFRIRVLDTQHWSRPLTVEAKR